MSIILELGCFEGIHKFRNLYQDERVTSGRASRQCTAHFSYVWKIRLISFKYLNVSLLISQETELYVFETSISLI